MNSLYEAPQSQSLKHPISWSQERDKAFLDAKQSLTEATMLVHPMLDAPVALTMDASNMHSEQWVVVPGSYLHSSVDSYATTNTNTVPSIANSTACIWLSDSFASW